MSGPHAFVDESQRHGIILVAAIVAPERLHTTRVAMRSLLLPGQTHLHFTKENPGRRGTIIRSICASGVKADVYEPAGPIRAIEARKACLAQMARRLAAERTERLVIEQDDSLRDSDRRVLFATVQGFDSTRFAYTHLPKRAEPLLWIADAVAWCWTHPDWRRRVAPIIRDVVQVHE